MSEWQPIETAPRDGEHIIIFFAAKYYRKKEPRAMFVGEAYWHQPGNPEAEGFWVAPIRGLQTKLPQPTHWMPLPEPPQTAST